MRKSIQVLGIGPRKSGISKNTNKPYDFTEVSILHEDRLRMEGAIGEVVSLDEKVLRGRVLTPGEYIDVEMWTQNWKTKIGAIYD